MKKFSKIVSTIVCITLLVTSSTVILAKEKDSEKYKVEKEFKQVNDRDINDNAPKKVSKKEGKVEKLVSINGIPYFETAEESDAEEQTEEQTEEHESCTTEGCSHTEKAGGIQAQGLNSWSLTNTSYYYTAWDRDYIHVGNYLPSKFTLTTSSETTVSITGSTKFGFKGVAEASLSLSVGVKWGKIFAMEVIPTKLNTTYNLESACYVKKRTYGYTHSYMCWNPFCWSCISNPHTDNYAASSHDKYSTDRWVNTTPY